MSIVDLLAKGKNLGNGEDFGNQAEAELAIAEGAEMYAPELVTEPTNSIKSVDFFKGGKAFFTVSGKGTHYTFKISAKKKNNRILPEGPFFVSLLTGPDNYANYKYLGMYDHQHPGVRLTAKSSFNNESVPVKTVRWAVSKVLSHETLPEGWAIQHEGKCCRCGRKLTTPESINNGIGPECIKMR